MPETIKIIFAGEGGQGIQALAKIVATAAADSGQQASYIPVFGVEQRGTPSLAFVTLSQEDEIRYPRFAKADWAIILQPRAFLAAKPYLKPGTQIIFDCSAMSRQEIPSDFREVNGLPANQWANEKFNAKASNLIFAGKLTEKLGLPTEKTWQAIKAIFSKKISDPKFETNARAAFELGQQAVLIVKDFPAPKWRPQQKNQTKTVNGKTATVFSNRCKGCGLCVEQCPVGALTLNPQHLGYFATPLPEVDLNKCTACDVCSRLCPDKAIEIKKEK